MTNFYCKPGQTWSKMAHLGFCILHSPAAAALLLDEGTLNRYESPCLFYHIILTFQNPWHKVEGDIKATYLRP